MGFRQDQSTLIIKEHSVHVYLPNSFLWSALISGDKLTGEIQKTHQEEGTHLCFEL